MTEAEILACWESTLDRYRLQLTPEVFGSLEAYIKGERSDLTALGQQTYYLDFPKELIREAEGGENAQMAGRALGALLSRRKRLFHYGDDAAIAHACYLAGWPLERLAGELFGRYLASRSYYGNSPAIVQAVLRDYPPEEFAKTARLYLARGGADNSESVAGTLAGALLASPDGPRYGSLVEPFCKTVSKIKPDSLAAWLLVRAGRNFPLIQKLLHQKLQNVDLLRQYFFVIHNGKFGPEMRRQMLEDDHLPPYYYYAMKWFPLYTGYNASVLPLLREYQSFWDEDPQGMLDAYEYLWQANQPEVRLGAMAAAAAMLTAGAPASLIPHLEETVCTMPNILQFSSLGKLDAKQWEYADYLRGKYPLEHGQNLIRGINSIGGSNQKLVSLFMVLYDYLPYPARFFGTILPHIEKPGSSFPANTIYEAALLGRGEWMGTTLAGRAEKFISIGFPRKRAIACYCSAGQYYSFSFDAALTAEITRGHEALALELLEEGDFDPPELIRLLELLYGELGYADYGPLAGLCKHKSKVVRTWCEKQLALHEQEARPLLTQMQPKLRGEAARLVGRLLKRWDNERKFGKEFAFKDNAQVVEFCEDNLGADADKLLAWLPGDLFEGLRFADLSGAAPACVPRFIISEYLGLTELYRVGAADKVAAKLHPADLQATLENIYSIWLDAGADTKRKLVLLPYCLYASGPQILKLRSQLQAWADAGRGALAAAVVPMIALNGGSVALMMVEGMANKFPSNQVKKAAKSAFAFAAQALEISADELADRIVPNLGFNREGELELDYGPRSFTVSMQPDFTLSIYDAAKGKAVKSLPKPAAGDDPVKAEAAKKAFSELKKQMKAVVQTQAARLEKVLMNGRCWPADRWTALFVENPILHRFAIGLVWGVYEDGKLAQSFRYMEDGTFNTVDEEEYTLPAGAQISLVHPVELGAEQTAAWQQQLDDYEITQPLAQLSSPVAQLAESDVENNRIVRYNGRMVSYGKMQAAAKKYDMVRGEVLDGGGFWCYHLVDRYLGLEVHIANEGMYMGMGYDETVPMQDVTVLRLEPGKEPEDDIKDHLVVDPRKAPARFICCALALLDAVVE